VRRCAGGGSATDTDLQLLESVRQGDAAALERLMSEHSGRVYRLAFGITRNSADAEEVVQDVFLTIIRKGETFQGRSAVGSWIYRITTNAALNKRRGKRAELESSLEELLPPYAPDGHRDGDRAWVLADCSQNPEEDLLSVEGRA
jgi:RNA polymerase sigma-70 factor (ECF subfamily)